MPNVLMTPSIFTRMTLMNLGGYLNVCRNMSKDYTGEFGKKTAKIGDTLSVRRPQRFLVTKGLGYQPQPITNTQVPIKVDQVAGVHFEWDSVERTLSLQDVNERYAKPAALALAHIINSEAAAFIAKNTFNAVGTPGTTPNSIATYLSAGDKLVQLGLPEGEPLAAIINRKMSSTYVSAVSTIFNPAATISGQYKEGWVAPSALGYDWYKDQTLYTHTVGPLGGTPLVDGATASLLVADGGNNGTMTLPTKGWTSAAATRLKAGDIFTIGSDAAGTAVHSSHPQTRVSTGDLQQFVVLADFSSDSSGNGSPLIFPAITPTGQYQNVDTAPADGAAINVLGAANVQTPQGLLLHKNAFAFLSVPLENPDPKGVEEVATETDPDTGLTLSFIRAFDSRSRLHINRFDTLYGFGRLYAEMACRIAA